MEFLPYVFTINECQLNVNIKIMKARMYIKHAHDVRIALHKPSPVSFVCLGTQRQRLYAGFLHYRSSDFLKEQNIRQT